ncbi:hypothetical protein Tco_1471111 [Tanacetum coccineum]
MNNVHDSCGISIAGVSGKFSYGFSMRKSARICPFTDVLGRGNSDKCFFSCVKACSASGVQWKSLFLMHFYKVLNSGKDFSADLKRNLFRLANFPLRLWTSLIIRREGSCSTTYVLSGHDFIPSGLIMYPKNILSLAPNVHFLGLSFMLILRNVRNVSLIFLIISASM